MEIANDRAGGRKQMCNTKIQDYDERGNSTAEVQRKQFFTNMKSRVAMTMDEAVCSEQKMGSSSALAVINMNDDSRTKVEEGGEGKLDMKVQRCCVTIYQNKKMLSQHLEQAGTGRIL